MGVDDDVTKHRSVHDERLNGWLCTDGSFVFRVGGCSSLLQTCMGSVSLRWGRTAVLLVEIIRGKNVLWELGWWTYAPDGQSAAAVDALGNSAEKGNSVVFRSSCTLSSCRIDCVSLKAQWIFSAWLGCPVQLSVSLVLLWVLSCVFFLIANACAVLL